MFKNLCFAICACVGLTACEVPVMIAANQNQGSMSGIFEITFPAVLLVQRSDGVEELLQGNLIGHANGNAKYDVTGPLSGHCTGTYTKKTGESEISCENGFALSNNLGSQRAKMSGTNIATGTYDGIDFVGAFGWGNDANDTAVRRAIEDYKQESS